MKLFTGLLMSMSLLGSVSQASDYVRDLKKHPLSAGEQKAYRAAESFAKELGYKTDPACVNADFSPDARPIVIQKYIQYIDGDYCSDPHYSIEVELDTKGDVSSIKVIDA